MYHRYAELLDLAPHLGHDDPRFAREQRVMNRPTFARLYETRAWRPLHGWIASRRSLAAEIDEVLAGAGTPRRAVDLACGTGPYTRAMARRWPGCEVLGVDLSLAMLGEARRRAADLPNVGLVRGDVARLPLADGSVEHVNCAGALHLFSDRAPVWREIARVLAPGGTFTAMTVARRPLGRVSLQGALERWVSFRFFDPDALRAEVAAHGLRARTVVRHAALFVSAVRA